MPTAPRPEDVLRAAERAYRGLPILLDKPMGDEPRGFSYTDGNLIVAGNARMVGTTVQLTRLEVRPLHPDGAIGAAHVKNLPIGRIVSSLQTLLTIDEARSERTQQSPPKPADQPEEPKRPRRGGRPPITDELLRELAEVYLAETAAGKPARSLDRIAERFGRPTETIRTWLSRARKDGWLAPAVKGRAGGEPGPKLLMARLAEESGMVPVEGESDAQRVAREARAYAYAQTAGELYDRLKAEGKL